MDEINATTITHQKRSLQQNRYKHVSRFAFLAAVLAFACTLFTTVSASSDTILFPVFIVVSTFIPLLLGIACVFVLVMLLVTGYFTFEHIVNPKHHPEYYGLELVLMMIASGLLLVAVSNAIMNDWLVFVDNASSSDNKYHLAERHIFDNLGYGNYVLYECLPPGIICTMVYEDRAGYAGPDTLAHLVADPEANALSIVIDGEIIYTYTPE